MAAQRLWDEPMEDDDDENDREGGELAFVPAVHAYQFLCLEDFEFQSQRCDCHGFELRRVSMGVGCNPRSELGVYLWCRLEDDPRLEGVYFIAAWAATMFSEFKPVFCGVPANGVLGMIIYVPPYKTERFVTAIGAMGDMGALPCHYCRRMHVDFANNRVVLFNDGWHAEAVNCMYYWQRGIWDNMKVKQ
ncbi:ORF22 [turkey adenovirus 4]|uniref:ORF22 n=1 Tax=turkey adenovirus 4 TaxID=1408257 RepID=U5NHP6_9ADEN|nr:ORF22 [Turkey aviadenovirus 4]AGX93317.1 ORF22 [Turkey aviadenovirus 4]